MPDLLRSGAQGAQGTRSEAAARGAGQRVSGLCAGRVIVVPVREKNRSYVLDISIQGAQSGVDVRAL
jgi:hypothetical protein